MTAYSTHVEPRPPARRSPGGIALLVIGVLLTLAGCAVFAGGAAAARAASAQDQDGYLTSPTTLFATDTAALTTPTTTGFTGGSASQVPIDLGRIRIRVEGDRPLFVGVASRADVDRYLADVAHSEVTEVRYRPFRAQYRDIAGAPTAEAPTAQTFWTRSVSGSGPQEVIWPVQAGDWAVVVMNQDGSAGVAARLQAGFHSDLLLPLAGVVVLLGLLLLLLGVPLLLTGSAAVGRSLQTTGPEADRRPGERSPVRITGRLDEPLSRWLWLVKWVLAVPHYIVLAGLWVAFVVTTVAAGVVILVSGRYPRSWFAFNVGVLRWTWRVGFYGYSALGTDRYPPFTLRDADYPAHLEVDHPDRLVNGLVLVKSWLLALPHLVVLTALTGGVALLPVGRFWGAGDGTAGFSVLGALVLVAGVILLFSQRYPRDLFGLVVGIDRWAYRVIVYTSLMRDEYPPFRLDQGPEEPHVERIAGEPTGLVGTR
jgi:hypothetical protein